MLTSVQISFEIVFLLVNIFLGHETKKKSTKVLFVLRTPWQCCAEILNFEKIIFSIEVNIKLGLFIYYIYTLYSYHT